jgi:hypothetical protein
MSDFLPEPLFSLGVHEATDLGDTARTKLFDDVKEAIMQALDQNDIALAEQYVQGAWNLAKQIPTFEYIAWAHWCDGLSWFYRDIPRAIEQLDYARMYYCQSGQSYLEGRVLSGLAGLLGQMGRLEEANAAIDRCMECLIPYPDDRRWMVVLINQSDILGRRGQYQDMLTTARRAEQTAREFAHRTHQARALINQAYAALCMGQLHVAEQALQLGRQIAAEEDAAELVGRATWNLARLSTYKGKLWDALKLLAEARQNFARVQIRIDQEGTVSMEEANLYERLRMFWEARAAAVQAADAFEQAQLPAESVEARMIAVRLLLAENQPNAARIQLRRAEELVHKVSGRFRALIQGYAAHRLLQANPKHYLAALSSADQAMATLQEFHITPDKLEVALIAADLAAALGSDDANERYADIAAQASQANLSSLERRACRQLARRQKAAVAYHPLRRAADIVVQERRGVPTEELKAHLLSGHAALYSELIEALLLNHRPDLATHTLLEFKGGAWADLAMEMPPPTPDPEWIHARTELHFWQEQWHSTPVVNPDYVQHRLQQAEDALTEITRRRQKPPPSETSPSIEEVQAAIPPASILIEFLVGETWVRACVMTSDKAPEWVRLCKRRDLTRSMRHINLLLASLQANPTPEARASEAQAQHATLQALLAELYKLLVAPLQGVLPATELLMLAPDHFLYGIPWAALYDGERYLGQNYPLLIVPSGVLLALSKGKPLAASSSSPLALGFAGRPPLQGIDDELASIQRMVPTALCINPADSSALAWNLPPQFLHVAAHGHANPSSPLLSQIELADGPLMLADVLHLNLHGTRLVTLSACETGTSPEQGSILLTMAGTFLSAGAGAVLASLWPVDDQATGMLMSHFYGAVQRGNSLATALQWAQQQIRATDYEHPYYWAAFQPLSRTTALEGLV